MFQRVKIIGHIGIRDSGFKDFIDNFNATIPDFECAQRKNSVITPLVIKDFKCMREFCVENAGIQAKILGN